MSTMRQERRVHSRKSPATLSAKHSRYCMSGRTNSPLPRLCRPIDERSTNTVHTWDKVANQLDLEKPLSKWKRQKSFGATGFVAQRNTGGDAVPARTHPELSLALKVRPSQWGNLCAMTSKQKVPKNKHHGLHHLLPKHGDGQRQIGNGKPVGGRQ